MNVPGFTAEASLDMVSGYHAALSAGATGDAAVQPAAAATCFSRCVKACKSDPNISDFNNCNSSCACTCAGRRGCWQ
jgi:hypothetical protein